MVAALTSWKRASILAVVTLLALWYALLCYWVLNPTVSDDYRKYYIDRTTTLIPVQQAKAARGLVKPLHSISFVTDQDFFAFWFATEADPKWPSWGAAPSTFSLAPEDQPQGAMIIASSYAATYLDNQQVGIDLNGTRIADFQTRHVPGYYLVEFDKNLLNTGGANQLEFHLAKGTQASVSGHRKAAITLDFIEIY